MESEQIIDVVRDWFDRDDWHYEYNAELQALFAQIKLHSKIKTGKIIVRFAEDCYTVYLVAPICGDKDNLNELNKYLAYANYGLRNGNFELDWFDGEIRYKTFVNCDGLETLPDEIIKDSTYIPCLMMDRYGNGLAALALGFSDADTEIKKAEQTDESDSEE